jgi:beta-glucosidase
MSFSKNFKWGVATAAYQIEGAPYIVGGGKSVWDMLCSRPGAIFEGNTGNVACDHYNRYKEDVALMKDLGIKNYRLSISWPRVLPNGTGKISAEGIAFYDNLIDSLLEAGIDPYVTLFHWDYPYELYCKGGWLNRDSADWFEEYVKLIVDRLSDRVTKWMTLNEPQCFINLGHENGVHAPGDKLGKAEVLRAAHNALRAHGRAVKVIRANAKKAPLVSWAPCGVASIPATNSPEDIEAARIATFDETSTNLWGNIWWMDPVYKGRYPEAAYNAFGKAAPEIRDGDMEEIFQPMDFFGVNIYHGSHVKAGADGKPEQLPLYEGFPRTAIQWPVTPECLYWAPKFYYERYGKPIYITENGLANTDWIAIDGSVKDPQRIDYLDRHLSQLKKAAEDGIEIGGYFQWSLMDNFEWAEGYKMRFGLVYVDYPTQRRIPKSSAYWYKNVIETNGENLTARR